MSSESRSELLEAVLAAKYELLHCDDEEKAECGKRLEAALTAILELHPKLSRWELLEAVNFKFNEYRAARLRAQRRRETI